MTDLIVVLILLYIVFILVSIYSPEILIYGSIIFCVFGLIICIIVLGAQFIHDPIGFSYRCLVTNNPIIVFTNNLIPPMSSFDKIAMVIKPGSPVAIFMTVWVIGVVVISFYALYKIFISPYKSRRGPEENK